ncbi:MAG: sigma-70 family RNA polymerase sigma factor, partial [Pseudomonadales bacterium]
MIVEPRIRGFICTTAHPTGCAANVAEQTRYVRSQNPISSRINNVLVIGSSGGYGLASRITAAFGCGAATLGVSFEKPPAENKTATAGWYNNIAFEEVATAEGLYAKAFDGEAYSDQIQEAAEDSSEVEERHASLKEALWHLPGRDRAILALRYQEGFEVAEIAEILRIPPGTVKSRLYYARKRLRNYLEET